MAQVLEMAGHKRIRGKRAAYFGSYGWSGRARRDFESIVEPLKWELTEPFEFNGGPTDEDLGRSEEFGAQFARMVRGE